MSGSSPHDDEDLQGLAGEYVLGSLPPAERAAVERRLAVEPALRDAVDEWTHRLAPLVDAVDPEPLPPRLWSRVERSLDARPPATAPAPAGWRAWWNSLPLWRGLCAGSLAAVVALVVAPPTAPPEGGPRYLVVLVAPQDKSPGWVIQADARRALTLVPLGMATVPQEKALQFWTKGEGWSAPLSLGLVQPGRSVSVPLEGLPPLQPNQLFELTLEPATGSPTGRPTGPIQFIGRAVPVI